MEIPEDDLPQVLVNAYNEWLIIKQTIPQVRLEDIVNLHILIYLERQVMLVKNSLLGVRLPSGEIENLLIEFDFDHKSVFDAIQDRWDTCLVP